MTEKKQLTEEFIAWGRYLSWADQHRKRLYNFFEAEGDAASSGHTARFITYTSQFFASLWVVVEGYNELTLRDNFVDSILRNPLGHADLLRRCRNGVYHFQPDLLASRLGDFLSATQSALAWVYALHSELIRVFWHFPERAGMTNVLVDEWREEVGNILGWLPDEDSLYVTITNFEKRIREDSAVVPDDDESPAAANVRAAIQQLRQAVNDIRAKLLKEQQRYREAGWLDSLSDGVV